MITFNLCTRWLPFGLVLVAGCSPPPTPTSNPINPQSNQSPTTTEHRPGDALINPAGNDTENPDSFMTLKPDVVLTAKEILPELNKDYMYLQKKYAGKVVDVSGIVDDYKQDAPGNADLKLRGGKKHAEDLISFFPVHVQNLASKLLPSQSVVLRTRMPASTNAKWVIVEVKGAVETRTSEQFAKELATSDSKVLSGKYNAEHPLIVTGTIAKVETEDSGTSIILHGDGKRQVECWFPRGAFTRIPLSEKQNQSLRADQTVKILGEYSSASRDLINCILIEPAY